MPRERHRFAFLQFKRRAKAADARQTLSSKGFPARSPARRFVNACDIAAQLGRNMPRICAMR
jgi:hypothetical protein